MLAVLAPSTTQLAEQVEDYLAECEAKGASVATLERCYGPTLRAVFLPWCQQQNIDDVKQLSDRVMVAFANALKDRQTPRGKPLAAASRESYMRNVKFFANWLKRKQLVSPDLAIPVPRAPQQVVNVLTREEINRLERAADNDRDRLIVRLLADTGIRRREMLNVTLNDIKEFGHRSELLVHGKGWKGVPKERLVPIEPAMARRLRNFAVGLYADEPIFRSRRGAKEALTPNAIDQMVSGLGVKARLAKRVYVHGLRHSFATWCIQNGMDLITLARILGHSSLTMLQRNYAHLTGNDVHRALMTILRGGPA